MTEKEKEIFMVTEVEPARWLLSLAKNETHKLLGNKNTDIIPPEALSAVYARAATYLIRYNQVRGRIHQEAQKVMAEEPKNIITNPKYQRPNDTPETIKKWEEDNLKEKI